VNLPNILTVTRILLTFIFIFFLYQDGLTPKILALVVFILASFTDFLDGYFARKHDLISSFGKIMDPIADKFLILSAFFISMQMHIISAWMFAVICAREVIVTGLRLFTMHKGRALAAERAGKVKTILQIVAVYLIIILIVLAQLNVNAQWYGALMSGLANGIYVYMIVVVLITLWSGLLFIGKNRKEIFHV